MRKIIFVIINIFLCSFSNANIPHLSEKYDPALIDWVGKHDIFHRDPLQSKEEQKTATKLFKLHAIQSKKLATIIKNSAGSLLSKSGKIIDIPEQNSLWIEDNQKSISIISQFIRKMDRSNKQISIKARIVSIDTDYLQTLGVLFSASSHHSISKINGAILPIAKLLNDTSLDAELDALEKQGHAKIISSPQLLTLNQQPAIIESGEEIPYQESTENGATSIAFKKAVLRLKVTPSLLPDQSLLLSLLVNQDKVSSLTINGVPAIHTEQLNTRVVMHDQQTLVTGGIYEQTQSQQQEGIPVLQHLPILGLLFKHTRKIQNKSMLLIFITPHTLTSL